ncbi:MAG: response regulator [Kiritimatiellae bacterium]|nr:response regulator [Kiritimatiellia bacterium]
MAAKTVFVVDDEPAVLATIDRVLTSEGYAVRLFDTADEAAVAVDRATAEGEPVDLVLLDVRLGPRSTKSGEAFLESLVGRQPPVEAIVMSGQLSAYALVDLVLKGAADFLVKPFSPQTLTQTVRAHVEASRRRLDSRPSPEAEAEWASRDVFIGCCTNDRRLGVGLKRMLEKVGISAWCTDIDLPTRNSWTVEQGGRILDGCRSFLLIVSPAALASDEILDEMRRAAARKRQQAKDYLFLALLLPGVDAAALPAELELAERKSFSNSTRLVDDFESLTHAIRAFLAK